MASFFKFRLTFQKIVPLRSKKIKSYPRGGGQGPGGTSECRGKDNCLSPPYHVHHKISDYTPSQYQEFVNILVSDRNNKEPPETIIYNHRKNSKPAPDFIYYHVKGVGKETQKPLVYEHLPHTENLAPDYIIYHHKEVKDVRKERKYHYSNELIREPIVIIDGFIDKKANYANDPEMEPYFYEDEIDNIHKFFEHSKFLKKKRKFKFTYEIVKSSDYQEHPQSAVHIYDPDLHNLSEHSKNPDILASLHRTQKKKEKKLKSHYNEIFRQEPYFEEEDESYEISTTTRRNKVITLATVKPFTHKTSYEDRERVPNLSPTDIMSSLFLQSLLVKAFDSNVLSNHSSLSYLPFKTSKISDEKGLLDSSRDPYGYKRNFTTVPSTTETIVTMPTTVIDASVEREFQSQAPSNAILDMLMRLVGNSTIMISKDPLLMMMNRKHSSDINVFQSNDSLASNEFNQQNSSAAARFLINNSTEQHIVEHNGDNLDDKNDRGGMIDLNSQTNSEVPNNTTENRSSTKDSQLLRNLEIHVHVHSDRQKVVTENPYISAFPYAYSATTAHKPIIYSTQMPTSHYFRPNKRMLHRARIPPIRLTAPPLQQNYHKPRITFLPPHSTTSPDQSVSKPPIVNYQNIQEIPLSKEASNPTGFRVHIPQSTTKAPIEYDVIVTRNPPVIDGETIYKPTKSNVNTTPYQTATPAILPAHPKNAFSLNQAALYSFPQKTVTRHPVYFPQPYLSFRTIKPIPSALFSSPFHEAVSISTPVPNVSTNKFNSMSLKKKPIDLVFQKQHKRLLHATPQSTLEPIVNQSASRELQPSSSQTTSSEPFIIPRYYEHLQRDLRALSAFNSLPDMFASSYSVPLPIQPHKT